jgi:hypothetical protein
MASGVAALDPAAGLFRYAIAPSGPGLKLLDDQALKNRADVVMMPPKAFRAMLRTHCRDAIVDHAAHHLGRRHPGQSAEQGFSASLARWSLIAGLALLLAGWFSPNATLVIIGLLTMPLFFGLVLIRLGATIDARRPIERPALRLPDDRLPIDPVLVLRAGAALLRGRRRPATGRGAGTARRSDSPARNPVHRGGGRHRDARGA